MLTLTDAAFCHPKTELSIGPMRTLLQKPIKSLEYIQYQTPGNGRKRPKVKAVGTAGLRTEVYHYSSPTPPEALVHSMAWSPREAFTLPSFPTSRDRVKVRVGGRVMAKRGVGKEYSICSPSVSSAACARSDLTLAGAGPKRANTLTLEVYSGLRIGWER